MAYIEQDGRCTFASMSFQIALVGYRELTLRSPGKYGTIRVSAQRDSFYMHTFYPVKKTHLPI